MSPIVLYLLLLKATVTSFSGFGSVTLVRNDLVVNRSVLTDEQLNNAIALSQASPGPLGIYLVIVGYSVTGVSGAVAGVLALSTPALLSVPILLSVQRRRTAAMRGGYSGVVMTSCVMMVVSGMRLAPQALPTMSLGVVAAFGFLVLAATRVPPVLVIAGAAVAGALFT